MGKNIGNSLPAGQALHVATERKWETEEEERTEV